MIDKPVKTIFRVKFKAFQAVFTSFEPGSSYLLYRGYKFGLMAI